MNVDYINHPLIYHFES